MTSRPSPLRGDLILAFLLLSSCVVALPAALAQQGTCGTAGGYFQIDGQFY